MAKANCIYQQYLYTPYELTEQSHTQTISENTGKPQYVATLT